jgi:hypothetical protein
VTYVPIRSRPHPFCSFGLPARSWFALLARSHSWLIRGSGPFALLADSGHVRRAGRGESFNSPSKAVIASQASYGVRKHRIEPCWWRVEEGNAAGSPPTWVGDSTWCGLGGRAARKAVLGDHPRGDVVVITRVARVGASSAWRAGGHHGEGGVDDPRGEAAEAAEGVFEAKDDRPGVSCDRCWRSRS